MHLREHLGVLGLPSGKLLERMTFPPLPPLPQVRFKRCMPLPMADQCPIKSFISICRHLWRFSMQSSSFKSWVYSNHGPDRHMQCLACYQLQRGMAQNGCSGASSDNETSCTCCSIASLPVAQWSFWMASGAGSGFTPVQCST